MVAVKHIVLATLFILTPCVQAQESDAESVIEDYIEAIKRGDLEAVQELLANDPSLISMIDNNRGKRSRGLPLHLAVRCGHAEIVELLLSKGVDPNERNAYKQGALHIAAERGHANLVKILVDYGADINGEKEGFRHPPLCYASNAEVAEALIKNGADVNWKDERRSTPLHSIAWKGKTAAAEVLIAYGADVNAKDSSGRTPLHQAAEQGKKEMVELLIVKGADINARHGGKTALNRLVMEDRHASAIADRKATAETLLSHGADYNIYDVAWIGDVERVRRLLEEDPSLANDGSNVNREPVLFAAVREGHSAIAELLLDNGVELNVNDKYKEPPLHVAAYGGHKEVAAVLIRKGADVNQKGAHGEMALHWAAAKGHCEAARLLVEEGTDVNAKTDKQRMDMDAIVETEADVVCWRLKYLESRERQKQAIAAGRSCQIMGELRIAFAEKDTALHSAAQRGHREIAELLLENGADVNATNRWGQTPLHYAVVFQHAEAVEVLLGAGAYPDVRMLDGSTAHDLASKVKDARLAEMLRMERGVTSPSI
jgi:ankyrin repeat protein